MTATHLGQIAFRGDVQFRFPDHLCCNCGTEGQDVAVIAQDTKQTKYFLAGGTELTIKLLLPFCPRCEPSSRRRPKSLLNWLLIFIAFLGAFLLILVFTEHPVLGQHPLSFSTVFAALSIASISALMRPRPGQSSYFQPVRIRKLYQEFLSGDVKKIRFGFSQPRYATAFVNLNQESIKAGSVEVVGK